MINLRPGEGNRSRGVDDDGVRARIREVVEAWSRPNEEGPAKTGARVPLQRPRSGVSHKIAAAGGWARLELVEQLGNVGSEVERAIRAHEAGRTDRFESALERALDAFAVGRPVRRVCTRLNREPTRRYNRMLWIGA